MAIQIQLRRDTSENWTLVNPILADGEEGFETDTKKRKVGNGISTWTLLTYSEVDIDAYDVGDLVQLFQNGLV